MKSWRVHASFLLLVCLFQISAVEAARPVGFGINVVTQYGAKGDGRTDDTRAIQRAISENLGSWREIYFPAGVYMLSAPLVWKDKTGKWGTGLRFSGEGRDRTILRLRDHLRAFNRDATRAVIYTGSKLYAETATGGGKDYERLGEGNEAFGNYIENMTIDTGRGNASAVGLDFLANNIGAVRHVTITGSGKTGLSLTRKWPGPLLLQDVRVTGFDTGIDVSGEEYAVTGDHIFLSGQREAGIRVRDTVLAINRLDSRNKVPAIISDGVGLLGLANATLTDGKPENAAIESHGGFLVLNLRTRGYGKALAGKVRIAAGLSPISATSTGVTPQPLIDWPTIPYPQFHETRLDKWASAADFGAKPDDGRSDAKAIQAALDSGATTIWLPPGKYIVDQPVVVRGRVRKIIGDGATLVLPERNSSAWRNAFALFDIRSDAETLHIERLEIDDQSHGELAPGERADANATGATLILHQSKTTLVLTDLITWGAYRYGYNAADGAGDLFIENVSSGRWRFNAGQNVNARQLNPENPGLKIENKGATLWALGLKTEKPGTVIRTSENGRTFVLGGFIYPASPVAQDQPMFVNENGSVAASYVTTAYNEKERYMVHFRELSSLSANIVPPVNENMGWRQIIPLLQRGERSIK